MHSLAEALHDLADRAEDFGADSKAVEDARATARRLDTACRALNPDLEWPTRRHLRLLTKGIQHPPGHNGHEVRAAASIIEANG